MSFCSLPIIDLKSNPDHIHRSLLLACSTTGFFYVSNHGLDALQYQMFSLSKEYFNRPLVEKLTHSLDTSSYQGYLRIGHENLDTTYSNLIDQKEAFKFRQSDLETKDKLPKIFAEEKNFLLIKSWFQRCYDLCMVLFEYLAEALEVERNYFTSRHNWNKEPGAALKLLHYPPVGDITSNINITRAGAHSDYGSLTLLFQHESRSGLEIFDRMKNEWYPVEANNDMIVVNFGDVFEYWSNGMIKSTIHRVILPNVEEKNHDRFSIAFFCDPNGDTPLIPIPSRLIENRTYVKDEHASHVFDEHDDSGAHVLTAGEHLLMRLNKSHKY